MSQIKQVLRQHLQGSRIKTIERDTGVSRNTIKVYLFKIRKMDVSIEQLLELPDPELEARFHSGNPAYRDGRYDQLRNKLD